MTSAAFEIAELDKSLAEDGEDIILRRVVGSSPTTQQFIDVTCRAFVRGYAAEDLIASITQRQRRVILSPTQINRAQWPGGQALSVVNDPRIPSKNRGDKCIILSDRATVPLKKAAASISGHADQDRDAGAGLMSGEIARANQQFSDARKAMAEEAHRQTMLAIEAEHMKFFDRNAVVVVHVDQQEVNVHPDHVADGLSAKVKP
jgi:hypothetical protein